MAAIVALEALNRPCQVELYSDSKYLVDAFNQHWIDSWLKKNWKRGKNENVKNVDLWKRLLKAKEQHQVSFHWVKGHADNPLNERCDQLATSAADGDELYVDEGLKRHTARIYAISVNSVHREACYENRVKICHFKLSKRYQNFLTNKKAVCILHIV